jgi:hypothetical protein
MGTVTPAGITQDGLANETLLASFKPVKVAEPDTTVNPAYEPVIDPVVTNPVAFTGIFAMFLFFK